MTKHPRYNLLPELNMVYASLSFNSRCNGNCVNCCGQILNEDDMPLEKIKEILDVVIKRLRIKQVFPSCLAEMTLIPYVNDIINYIDEIRIPDLIVSQDTNARFIPDGFIDALNACRCIYHLSISIWGYDKESWESVQGKGSFEKTVKNIETYLRELKLPPTFSFPYITEEQYTKTVAFIKELCRRNGYEITVTNSNGSMQTITYIKKTGKVPVYVRRYSVNTGNYAEVYENGKKLDYISFNNCSLLFQGFFLDAQGNVYPCSSMYRNKEHILGNVNDYSPFTYKDLLEVLHSEKSREYIKRNFSSDGTFACDICEKCSGRIIN